MPLYRESHFVIAMLIVIVLSFIVLHGIMLNVIMLVVVAPHKQNLCALSNTCMKGASKRQAPATLSKTRLGVEMYVIVKQASLLRQVINCEIKSLIELSNLEVNDGCTPFLA